MRNEYDYNQYLDSIIDTERDKNFDVKRIPFLLGIYHPGLNNKFKEICTLRDTISSIRRDHKNLYKSGATDHGKYLGELTKAIQELNSQCENLQDDIVSSLRV